MTFLGSNPSSTLDGNSNVINSVLAATGVNGLAVATVATNFIYSTNNSTTTQLAPNATYTGTIETALSQPAISLLMTADQNMVLTLKQFIDLAGTYAVAPMVFFITAGQQFSRSIVLNGNYIQMTATNQGSATTTTFNLNTAYGTIDAVDSQGNKPTVSYIIGQTTGDFNDVATLDAVIRGDLSLSTQVINQPTRDINGNLILSDAPFTGRFTGIAAQAIIIDTQGYQTLQITTNSTFAATGGVQFSNDGINFTANAPGLNGAGFYTTVIIANTSYTYPCIGRYAKIVPTTAGAITYFLRNIPSQLTGQNLVAINSAAVSASTAQLGMSIVNIGAAAQSSTNPLNVTPLALATTNNQTIGQSIITATAAAVVQAKATAGRLTMLNMQNNSANIAFLHLQNNATATTSTASVQTYVIPASIGSFVSVTLPDGGLFLSAGIAFTVSGLITSGDTTALTSPSLVVNYSFI
jgi:hypothetical protein